ncbi:MAG: phosphatase PAP2 family protein [Acidimicrobiales bacterium]
MWVSWGQAAVLATVLVAVTVVLRPATRGWVRTARAVTKEAAVVATLYSIWQLAGTVSVMKVDRALDRSRTIWRLERWLHLPSEVSVQRAVLPHPWLVEAANQFYAVAHGTALLAFLVWLFARHRDRYPRTRNVIALVTGAALAIQLIPVAPPRMLDELGFVDTALLYHQSVYTALGRALADQLSAMPSVHVAWAVLIAVVVMRSSTSRWRWLVLAHPVVTVVVVVVTANHFWLDGVVAVGLIALAYPVLSGVQAGWERWGPGGADHPFPVATGSEWGDAVQGSGLAGGGLAGAGDAGDAVGLATP